MQKSISWQLLRLVLSLAVLTCTLPLAAVQAASDGTDSSGVAVRTPDYELSETGVTWRAMRPTMCRGCRCSRLRYARRTPRERGLGDELSVHRQPRPRPARHSAVRAGARLSVPGRKSGLNARTRSYRPSAGHRPARTGRIRNRRFRPRLVVTSKELVWQDGRRLLPLRVYPFQYNPVTGELRYHPEIRIQIKIKASATGIQPEAAPVSASLPRPRRSPGPAARCASARPRQAWSA